MIYTIQLTNKKTGEKIVFDDQQDYNNGEKLYYKFLIDGRNIADGEYDLEITDQGQLVMADTLYVGDFNKNSLQYKRGENTYIEIILDAKFQNKDIEISEVNTVISPDDDFDGIKTVTVDAEPIYNKAYSAGSAAGFVEGKNAGIEEQKSKLETIVITENGSYSKEDGYNEINVNVPDLNGDYNEGYNDGLNEGLNNAGSVIAETAQVLNITENGNYATAFSKVEDYGWDITGYLEDGKPFYNYSLNKFIVFDTGYQYTNETKIKFWFKPNYSEYSPSDLGGSWRPIIGNKIGDEYLRIGIEQDGQNPHLFRFCSKDGYKNENTSIIEFIVDNDDWILIEMDIDNGLVVNGNKIGDIVYKYTGDNIVIGGSDISAGYSTSNVFFGIIIINDNYIIPTENGYFNFSTNEYLQLVRKFESGKYEFYELPQNNLNLIRSVIVNVKPKINVLADGLKFAFSSFTSIPQWADFSNIIDMQNMFYYCSKLKTIPLLDTSNVTNMYQMFLQCESLNEIPLLDTSNVTNMCSIFERCINLKTIPLLDTSNVINMESMFEYCGKLETLPELDTSNVTNMKSMFSQYGGLQNLKSLPKFNVPKLTDISRLFYTSTVNMPNLTEVGGWENLKCNWNDNGGLKCLPNLTYQSCINILNGLYDFTGNGETPTSSQGNLKVHQNFIDLVGEEISIGTSKGWTITA